MAARALFKAAGQKASTKRNLWAKLQSYLQDIELPDWDTLWLLIGGGLKLQMTQTDDTEYRMKHAVHNHPR